MKRRKTSAGSDSIRGRRRCSNHATPAPASWTTRPRSNNSVGCSRRRRSKFSSKTRKRPRRSWGRNRKLIRGHLSNTRKKQGRLLHVLRDGSSGSGRGSLHSIRGDSSRSRHRGRKKNRLHHCGKVRAMRLRVKSTGVGRHTELVSDGDGKFWIEVLAKVGAEEILQGWFQMLENRRHHLHGISIRRVPAHVPLHGVFIAHAGRTHTHKNESLRINEQEM